VAFKKQRLIYFKMVVLCPIQNEFKHEFQIAAQLQHLLERYTAFRIGSLRAYSTGIANHWRFFTRYYVIKVQSDIKSTHKLDMQLAALESQGNQGVGFSRLFHWKCGARADDMFKSMVLKKVKKKTNKK